LARAQELYEEKKNIIFTELNGENFQSRSKSRDGRLIGEVCRRDRGEGL